MTTFSQFLRDFISDYDEDFVREHPPEEQAEAAVWVAKTWVEYILQSVEGFSAQTHKSVEASFASSDVGRRFLEDLFDEYYSRDFLNRIPKMVRRTMRLSPLIPGKMPSQGVNLYLKEATRTYVFGFWQGSVALSRAAVERGLREEVQSRVPEKQAKYYDLVTAAIRLRLLDDEHAKKATQVEVAGNRVLHGNPSNERESWGTLDAARSVLAQLYSAEK